jgi:predicted AAA+ superfamily ATPase
MEHYNNIARGVVDPFMRIVYERWGSDLHDVPRMLVVMRGLPRSGKTTLAETIVEYAGEMAVYCMIFSTNAVFMQNGVFQFNADDLGRAHDALS